MNTDQHLQAIQETLLGIREDMGFVKGSLKGMRAEQERIAEYAQTTSARVGALERQVSRMLGWAVGVAATVSLAVSFLKGKVFG